MFENRFTRGMIVPIDGAANIVTFEWNPYEVQIIKDTHWRGIHVAGREQPVFQYGCGEAQKVVLAIEVSQTNNPDFFVRGYFDTLTDLARPYVIGMGVNRPTRVQLILGDDLNMCCFIERLGFRYGSHRGQTHHHTYLAHPDTLYPREGHVVIDLMEYM